MSRGIFGWDYPPGCSSVPGDEDPEQDNSDFEEQFSDYASLHHLYISVYRYTACGPTLGVTVYMMLEQPNSDFGGVGCYPDENWGDKTFYGHDLSKLGTWLDMNDQGILIKQLHVSSIVEGCDEGTGTITVNWNPLEVEPKELKDEFWKAVEDTNSEADRIWNETHGCDTCRKHWETKWEGEHGWIDDDHCQVWEDCPDCNGNGVPK